MNLTLLINRWEKEKEGRSIVEVAVLDKCISDLKMLASGELREPYTLDSTLPFGKYKGQRLKEVIEAHSDYVDWCLANLNWFTIDEDAHAYLCQMQGTYHDEQSFSDHYDDLKREG